MSAAHLSAMESCVPPGFRFHPTEEELVGYYLNRKISSLKIDLDVIVEIDLYKIEPWDIQEICKLGYDEQNEWYFFSHKDKKYPTGTRTNRATAAGFWKATGRDKAVMSKNRIIGMRKTLVFYKGRAPNGRKTDWIMHEYRLQTSEHGPPQEEGWVVCRAFRKPSPSQRQGFEAWNQAYLFSSNTQSYARPPTFSDIVNTSHMVHLVEGSSFNQPYTLEQQQLISNHTLTSENQLIELPQLDSPTPTLSTSLQAIKEGHVQHEINGFTCEDYNNEDLKSNSSSQCIDWKSLDNLFTPQAVLTDSSYLPMIPYNHSQASHNDNIFGSFLDS